MGTGEVELQQISHCSKGRGKLRKFTRARPGNRDIQKGAQIAGVSQRIQLRQPLVQTRIGQSHRVAETSGLWLAEYGFSVAGVPVDLLDERWTSQAAELSLSESKGGRKKRREAVDAVAATLLLRTYLERQFPSQAPCE